MRVDVVQMTCAKSGARHFTIGDGLGELAGKIKLRSALIMVGFSLKRPSKNEIRLVP
jgi:hypothetical protein